MLKKIRKSVKHYFKPPKPGITATGDYPSWEAASRDSKGYDSAVILEKTSAALMKVKNREAAMERDSVTFDKITHSYPVLAALLRAAQADGGRLCVLDFGGALGSSYFQCRDFLTVVPKLEWLVVEQKAHIACGRKNFASQELHFYENIEDCASHRPNALLLSSVLPYLPDPYGMLGTLLKPGFSHVIIDRTGYMIDDRERLTVQRVPDSIYPASYPAWFFSETKLVRFVEAAGYRLVSDFPGTDKLSPEGGKAIYKGFIFEKRRPA